MAGSFIATLDHDRDGSLSTEEQRAYARQMVSALEVQIDEQPVQPRMLSWRFPELSALRRGEDAIRLQLQATFPNVSVGSHQTSQRRDRDQSQLTIEYTVHADSPGGS